MLILLTGAGGQVGYECAKKSQALNRPVLALTRRDLDITDASAVWRIVNDARPDVIINAAAYTAVDRAEDEMETAFRVNRGGTANLADAAARVNIPLIHLSTDYVFDGTSPQPYKESDTAAPIGVYGQSKWEGETAIRLRLAQHLIIRVSWVFGFHGKNFVKTILKFAKERGKLRVVYDQKGAPTCASHIADLLIDLYGRIIAEGKVPWGTYHYCGKPSTNWHAFAETIVATGRRYGIIDRPVTVQPISTRDYPTRIQRPANSILDCSLLKKAFGIEQPSWGSGLEDIIERISKES
jgi:dTDP-4-dehydrorhamnose reductase